MKTKPKPRARRLWANFYSNGAVAFFSTKRSACLFNFSKAATVPVAVIPLDDVDALVLKASLAIDNVILCGSVKVIARAALTAIGVLPKQRKGGRK